MTGQLALAGHEMPIAHGVAEWWPTPPWLADRLVEWADLTDGERVVEPSAGDGALVRAVRARTPSARIIAVELAAAREHELRAAGADDVVIGDWPTVAATWSMHDRPTFDLALSNPPFSLVAQHLWPMVAVARCPECLLGEAAGLLADLAACEASAAVAAPPAPVLPPLGRGGVGGGAEGDAAEVLRGLLADARIRRSIEHEAREWSAVVESHEHRAAQHPEGSQARATQDERAREARQHRDLYRAVLALHVAGVAHDVSVAASESCEEAP